MKFEFDNLPVSPLVGADITTFNKIVKGRRVDATYRGKFLLTKAISVAISSLGFIERWRYRRLFKDKSTGEAPLFILGHWRSGTTFVHNVFSCDRQFGYTTTYQTVFPNVVLFAQGFFKGVMRRIMPDKRPIDNIELNPDLPQEEEFALAGMMPYSYYNFWFFPEDMLEYCDRFMLMTKATEQERATFRESFERLVKLSLHNTGGGRYLSKNPPHTGRVEEILKIFPDAKFIYLMRNPYTVFESTRGFFTQTSKSLRLHDISDEQLQDNFVEVYARLYDKYQRDKALIPEGNLVEVKFEDFETDPVETTRSIYDSLSLDGFEQALPAIKNYVGEKRGHKKNKYNYAEQTLRIVDDRWGEVVKSWGYTLE